MIILGIDPGIARTGWGVVTQRSKSDVVAIQYGCIETSQDLSEEKRLVTLYEKIHEILTAYKPDHMAIEKLFFASNQKTALTVGQARGVLIVAAGIYGISVTSYTPLQVKQAITGYGRASKQQIQRMVQSILKLSAIPKPDDTADALAVALTHCYTKKWNA